MVTDTDERNLVYRTVKPETVGFTLGLPPSLTRIFWGVPFPQLRFLFQSSPHFSTILQSQIHQKGCLHFLISSNYPTPSTTKTSLVELPIICMLPNPMDTLLSSSYMTFAMDNYCFWLCYIHSGLPGWQDPHFVWGSTSPPLITFLATVN